ncbi:MAG: flagellar motor switch phosphatase FliY [Thermotoga sp.]|nr:MAG: flagellar motor switch phosphatase FliY [Thermotoga sp.]
MGDSNEFLSQEELDALLKGLQEDESSGSEKESADSKSEDSLTPEELDAIAEISNIKMGSAATALSTILGKTVNIETPEVSVMTLNDLKKRYKGNMIVTAIEYTEGLKGLSVLMTEPKVAAVIADLMMGGTGKTEKETVDEIGLSAVGEAMNQMMGSAVTTLSDFLGMVINIAPPNIKILNFDDPNLDFPPVQADPNEPLVIVQFKMKIEDLATTYLVEVYSMHLIRELIRRFKEKVLEETKEEQKELTQEKVTISQPAEPQRKEEKVPVRKVEFAEMESEGTQPFEIEDDRLKMLYDIPLEISVELGRTRMTLKQILDMDIGSIIELEKLTGEPVDVLVNGKLIARGEVVAIGENFGVRITEIVSQKERLYSLR